MECPVCGAVGDHRVERTLAKAFDLPPHTYPAVAIRAFNGGKYRIRMKFCAVNGCKFDSVELDRDTFKAVLDGFKHELQRKKKMQETMASLRTVLESAEDVIGTTAKNKALKKFKDRILKARERKTKRPKDE